MRKCLFLQEEKLKDLVLQKKIIWKNQFLDSAELL